ncbi:hypothetical protein B0H11DRAFT_2248444 [Mycena galericulata]|nr:hypothetical protein B0H11DRAFT_2248444 [Mycena galericulata]
MASAVSRSKRSVRVIQICIQCRRRIEESALEVAPLVPYIDGKIQEALHDKLLPNAPPWNLEETLNVPYCCDQAEMEDEEDDDLPTNCSVCAPYLRHCGAAYAGFSDIGAYVAHLAYLREEAAKTERKVPVIIMDDNGAEEMNTNIAAGNDSQVCRPGIPDQGLVDHMKVVSQLQSVRGRKVVNKLLHTDPTATGCLQGVVAVLEQREASAKSSLAEAEARVLELQEALQKEERELHKLRRALDSVEDIRPRKIPNSLVTGTAPKSASTLAPPRSEPTFLQILAASPPIDTQTPAQLARLRQMLMTAKTPSYDDPPEAYAKWLQFRENRFIKGVPLHGPDWVVDLRDVRSRNAVLSRVPPGPAGTWEQRHHHMDCLLAVLRVLSIPRKYANIIQRTGIFVAGTVDLSCRFAPPGLGFSPPSEVDLVRLLAGQGLTVETADDAWQFCYKFVEAHANANESMIPSDVAKNLLVRINEKIMNSSKPRTWCPECPRFVMKAQESSPLASEMEDTLETELAKTLKDGHYTWRLDSRTGIGIPICGSRCGVCSAFLSHVAKSRGRRRSDEDEDGDDSSEDDEPDDDSDESGSDEEGGGEEEDENEEEDLTEDEDLVEHMNNLFKLHCLSGRIRTNHLFKTDRAALGRAQDNIAELNRSNSILEEKMGKVQVEAARLEQKLHDIQKETARLRNDLEQLDPNASRKRLVVDDGLTGNLLIVEQPENPANPVSSDSQPHHEKPSAVESVEDIAAQVLSRGRFIPGVPVDGPGQTVDLRNSSRDNHRKRFLAVVSVIAIPGLYAQRIHSLCATIAAVELSSLCAFGSKFDEDVVVRRLADNGLTTELADDCWQFCYKFLGAEIGNCKSAVNLLDSDQRAKIVFRASLSRFAGLS